MNRIALIILTLGLLASLIEARPNLEKKTDEAQTDDDDWSYSWSAWGKSYWSYSWSAWDWPSSWFYSSSDYDSDFSWWPSWDDYSDYYYYSSGTDFWAWINDMYDDVQLLFLNQQNLYELLGSPPMGGGLAPNSQTAGSPPMGGGFAPNSQTAGSPPMGGGFAPNSQTAALKKSLAAKKNIDRSQAMEAKRHMVVKNLMEELAQKRGMEKLNQKRDMKLNKKKSLMKALAQKKKQAV